MYLSYHSKFPTSKHRQKLQTQRGVTPRRLWLVTPIVAAEGGIPTTTKPEAKAQTAATEQHNLYIHMEQGHTW